MNESFSELFEQSLSETNLYPGAVILGKVLAINDDFVIVDSDSLKSESYVPIAQFKDENDELEVEVGDEVELVIEALENGCGDTRLSRERAKKCKAWNEVVKMFEAKETVKGLVTGRVKGGFTVILNKDVRAFLPGSLIDVKQLKDPSELEGQELEFKIIKVDKKRNNVVVSRRSAIEAPSNEEREALLNSIEEGQIVKGVIKNLTDYGAFVDLGGVDGLLHITDMAWKRVKHPSEVVKIGQEVTVKVLKFDKDKTRVSLGIKQMGEDPWINIKSRYPEGSKFKGVVTNITDYGCFVEILDGVEGLVHVSEMDWTNKNVHPSKVVKLGMEVEVLVLEIDEERRRISLGIKQCTENPWDVFAQNHEKGEKITGKIKSITDFGIFIGLEGGIDGLIHSSDLSWIESGEDLLQKFKKGEEIEALILGIDPERERISLGIKQFEQDPYAMYIVENPKNSIVKGKILDVTAKGAVVSLAENVEGYLRVNEISSSRVDDARSHINVGDEIETKIIGLDRKNRTIMLSIKAKDIAEEKNALKELKKSSSEHVSPTFGDLMKDQMKTDSEEE